MASDHEEIGDIFSYQSHHQQKKGDVIKVDNKICKVKGCTRMLGRYQLILEIMHLKL